MLGGTKVLREKEGGEYKSHWSNVFITPDLTKEEREKSKPKSRVEEKKR